EPVFAVVMPFAQSLDRFAVASDRGGDETGICIAADSRHPSVCAAFITNGARGASGGLGGGEPSREWLGRHESRFRDVDRHGRGPVVGRLSLSLRAAGDCRAIAALRSAALREITRAV